MDSAHVIAVVADRHRVLQPGRRHLQGAEARVDEAILPARRAVLRRGAEVHLRCRDVEGHEADCHFQPVLNSRQARWAEAAI